MTTGRSRSTQTSEEPRLVAEVHLFVGPKVQGTDDEFRETPKRNRKLKQTPVCYCWVKRLPVGGKFGKKHTTLGVAWVSQPQV